MNVLIIYSSRVWPMRSSQRDHLQAFKKYSSGFNCFYLNLAFAGYPAYLNKVPFDLIVFDWSFVGGRVEKARFKETLSRIEHLRSDKAIKVCMPQDEFTCMDVLCDFINDFNVKYVFTVAPATEWSKIYKTINQDRVSFFRVLTGYLDEEVVKKWSNKSRVSFDYRPLDIGYRTVSTAIWGRFNLHKATIAEIFQEQSALRGLKTDIKVGAEYFKLGDEWLKFLSRCRFTLGIEGGSRILDWDGSILCAVTEYIKSNPRATFDELAGVCVPVEREGEVNVIALSPRHLEACLTSTVQILVEGDYNGILKPNVHYIPLKLDFSNISEVFVRMDDVTACRKIAETAYNDIVASNKYSYRSMVELVMRETVGLTLSNQNQAPITFIPFLLIVNRACNMLGILYLYTLSRIRSVRNFLIYNCN